MAKFRVINGTPPPDSPAERVRVKRPRYIPSCGTCGGIEYITARAGNTTTKLCAACLMQGRRREMGMG